MSLKLIFISSLIVNLIYLLLNVFIFYGGSYLSGRSIFEVIKMYGPFYIVPIFIVIVLFVMTQYQINIDKENLLSIASNKTKNYYFINLALLIFSTLSILKVSGGF